MALTVTHALVSAIADDPVAAAAGEVVPSDWNADHTIAVTSLTIATGTITASEPVLDLSQTWNAGAVTFTGIKLEITDTASSSSSEFLRLSIGGVEKFFVRKNGLMLASYGIFGTIGAGTTVNYYATGLRQSSSGEMSWTSGVFHYDSVDVSLFRDAAATLALRNGVNAQTFRVYGTYTDSSNYVRAALSSSSTAVTLAAETAGTGADNVPVNITPAGTEGVQIGNFAQLTEMTAPAAGAANTARIYAEDNGAGKTRLMVIFPSGAAQQIAIEP